MKVSATVLCIAAALVAGCNGNTGNSFPRPTAYPRPNLPDTLMVSVTDAPLYFTVNAEAVVSSPRAGWFDVAYPMLGATVHVTFTDITSDNIDKVKENRMERLMLNAGDRPVDFSEFTNTAGFDIVVASAEGSLTPVQFLATDDSLWVISGSAYFSSPGAAIAIDSIRPMVKAISRDLYRTLNELSYK